MSVVTAAPQSPLASRTLRLTAQWIDAFIAMAIVALSAVPVAFSTHFAAVTFWIGVLIAILYILLSDGFHGQSYGKRVIGIIVIDSHNGHYCSFRQSLIRNLLLIALALIDWVFILGERRQRLGDRLAGTKVICDLRNFG